LNYLFSFLIGGLICIPAQILIDKTKLSPARILVLYVIFGSLLSAFDIYSPLFKIAGAGASVPLIGFGATVIKGTKELIDEIGPIGILKGPFSSASAGCSAAIILGYIVSLIFKSKPKRA
jgi:stage V sporulation protein AE